MRTIGLLCAAWLAATGCARLAVDEETAIFLSKSAGYEHSCIKWDENKVSHVDRVFKELTPQLGVDILCTKDASLINAENLKKYRLVIFYTTADLTQPGTDQQPPMGPNGQAELLEWIRNGGGFMGFHCATDSFHTPEGQPPTPYVEMIGGEFRTHGKQFEGILRVVDPKHPAMASFPADWRVFDEWYLFRNFNTKSMHVLAMLDPGDERGRQAMYDIPAYPIVWCSQYGQGRVYYNAMGHREDVWTNPTFQKTVIDAAKWVMGEGPAMTEPNFSQVMTADDAQKAQAPIENK